jgi:ribosomal protein S7
MRHGKQTVIEGVVHNSLKLLKNVTTLGLFYFFECLFIIKPVILLRWVRKGRFFYQVARPVHEELQLRVGCFFIAKFLRIK